MRKAEHEIAEFRKYQELSRAFVEVNEKICRARPLEDTLSPQEKTAEVIQQEVAREVDQLLHVIFSGRRKTAIWIWKPSRWQCVPPCITPVLPR